MLTKIRSLFLISSAARWRKARRDAACPRTGRLASKHRAPPAISWCGFTGRRGSRHLLGAIAAPHPIVIPDRALELDVQKVVEVLVPRESTRRHGVEHDSGLVRGGA